MWQLLGILSPLVIFGLVIWWLETHPPKYIPLSERKK